MKRIGICFEQPPGNVDIAIWRAAAETLRAGIFLARFTYFTPMLLPLAATIARAAARPPRSEEAEPGRPVLPVGDRLPIVYDDAFRQDDPSLLALTRHWSTEAHDLVAGFVDRETSLDVCVALTPPQSEVTWDLMSRARRLVGFRNLPWGDGFGRFEKLIDLDADWSPRSVVDPESGRQPDGIRFLPPFGLFLQRYVLHSLG